MADVSAKDGSQETCVNLLASCFGLYILTLIEDNTWCEYFLLISILAERSNNLIIFRYIWSLFCWVTVTHIYANYKAVKCLKLRTLNTSRFSLLVRDFLKYNNVNSVSRINDEESVILGLGFNGGCLSLTPNIIYYQVNLYLTFFIYLIDRQLCGKTIFLGGSFQPIICKKNIITEQLKKLKNFYRSFQYIVVDVDSSVHVILKDHIKDEHILMAYFHAIIYGLVLSCLEGKKQVCKFHET